MPDTNSKWFAFLIVATGVFMSTLDSSMVNIALPTIMKEFHSPLHRTEWVVMIYLLTITASLMFWGHLADRLGRGRMYAAGLIIFSLGSLACAQAPGLSMLIFSRFGQAIGAAMMMSSGPAIIKETFPPEQLGRALGLIGVAVSLGLMSGPGLGGLLLELFSWRALFLITVPLGLGFAVFAVRILPRKSKARTAPRVDWPGGLVWALALTLASVAITHATSPAWSITAFSAIILPAALAVLLFIRIETLTPHPLLPLSLLRQRFFSLAVLSAVLSFMVLFSVIMLIPFFLDRVMGLPSSRVGLIMLALPASILVVAPLAGWLSERAGPRLLPTLGLAVSTGGLFLLTGISTTSTPWGIAARLVILGCGQAMFLSPNSAAVLGRVRQEQAGAAAALLATARNLGMLLGIAQAGLLFSFHFGRLTNGLDMKDFSAAHVEPFMAALHGAFLAAAATGLLGVLASWLRENGRSAKPLSALGVNAVKQQGPRP